MSKIIDVVLQLRDKMTGPMNKSMRQLQANARKYQKMGRDIQRTGKSITAAGAALTKTITAPAAALAGIAYKEYGEYDKQMRLVQQTMGSTAEESKMLSEAVKKAAKDSVYGMQDAADAALNYARAGYDAKTAADMIAPAFNLAAGTATDLSTVTAGLGATMKAFGADSEEASQYADILAKAQAQAATTTTDLFDSTAKASSIFKTAGWNISDLATATGVLGDAYISGAEAGNALKSGIANLIGDKAIGYLKKLGVEITNADGTFKSFADTQEILHNAFEKMTPVMKTQTATAIFGKFQMAKWLKLIERSPEDIRRMEDALGGASGTARDMSDALMSGPGGAIEKLKSNWDIFKKTFGETVAPIITPILEKITELMQKFSEMSDDQRRNILKWIGVAAAIGPALMVVGKLTSGVGSLIGMFGKLSGAVSGIGGLFGGLGKLLPIGLLAGGIGLIGGCWNEVSSAISNAWDSSKSVTENLDASFHALFDSVEEGGIGLGDKLRGVFEGIGSAAKGIFDTIVPHLEKIGSKLGDITSGAMKNISDLSGVETTEEQRMENFWTGVKGFFDTVLDYITDVVGHIWTSITSIVTGLGGLLRGVWDACSGLLTFLKGVFTLDLEDIVTGIKDFFGGIANAIIMLFKGVANVIAGVLNLGIKVINTLTGWIPWLFTGGDVYNWIPEIPTFDMDYPGKAKGDNNWRGGLVNVHEKGGELIDLPRGSRIYPHDQSIKMAYQDGMKRSGNTTVNIPKLADQIVVRQEADIDLIATKLAHRLEKTSLNLGASQMGYQY